MLSKLSWSLARCGAPLLAAFVCACSVDQRTLKLGKGQAGAPSTGGGGNEPAAGGEPGTAGTDSVNGGSSGGSSNVSGAGGSSGASSNGLVNGCADLDVDGVADCQTTFAKNPSFKTDTTNWAAVGSASLVWDSNNALADTPSGCARLSAEGTLDIDGSVLVKAEQCVPLSGQQIVIAYANAFVETGVHSSDLGLAELEVSFFDSEDCTGQRSGYFETPTSPGSGKWTTIHAGGVPGAATKSVAIALAGLKAYRAEKLDICFDNVMLKTKAL
jgi:hypothetical protein